MTQQRKVEPRLSSLGTHRNVEELKAILKLYREYIDALKEINAVVEDILHKTGR